jgi:hypothetical protein
MIHPFDTVGEPISQLASATGAKIAGSGLCENDGPFEIVTVEKEFQACNVFDI